MCLNYGTPKRFIEALNGADHPLECENRDALLALLKQELRAGAYDDETIYHPLLKLMLQGLVRHHARLCRLWREPQYPFCDVVQSVALVFGFINGFAHVPGRNLQDALLENRLPGINNQVYIIVRNVALRCVPARQRKPWAHVMRNWQAFSGAEGLIIELGLKKPRFLKLQGGKQLPGHMGMAA